MSDPRDPDAAAREAAALVAKGTAHFERREWAEALKAFRAVVAVDRSSSSSKAWLAISAAEFQMNGGKHCEAQYVPLTRCLKLDPNNACAREHDAHVE